MPPLHITNQYCINKLYRFSKQIAKTNNALNIQFSWIRLLTTILIWAVDALTWYVPFLSLTYHPRRDYAARSDSYCVSNSAKIHRVSADAIIFQAKFSSLAARMHVTQLFSKSESKIYTYIKFRSFYMETMESNVSWARGDNQTWLFLKVWHVRLH